MVSRLEFTTRDPERALPVLKEFFPTVRMSNPRGNFSFEMESFATEPLGLVHYHLLSPTSSSSVDMAGTLTFGQLESGNLSLTADRHSIDSALPWLFPQQAVRGDWDEVTITALTVSISSVLRFARAQLGDDTFRLKFTGSSPTDAARARQWVALVNYLRVAFAEETVVQSEIVQANALAHIMSMLLATFPNSFMDAARSLSETTSLPGSVRRAVAFMEENADRPITVEDIAGAARLSVRGLQYVFRNALDTTPTAYLRRVRLAAVHSQLQSAEGGSGVTVLGTALSWGFSHPGRFAKQYRAAYGVTPRRTLES
jgi:AraC-like DNA-binding protein